MLPELLAQLRRVIYLDVDVEVHRDLGRLWLTQLWSCAIGAVRDFPIIAEHHRLLRAGEDRLSRYFREALNLEPDTYVNAGILLMNLHSLRQSGFGPTGIAMSRDRQHEFVWGDQDVINVLLAGRVRLIDSRWNYIPALPEGSRAALRAALRDEAERQRDMPFITHHAGPDKPWARPTRVA